MQAHTTPVGYFGPARAGRLRRLANIGKPEAYNKKNETTFLPRLRRLAKIGGFEGIR